MRARPIPSCETGRQHACRLGAVLALGLALAGCGGDVYEKRLANTAKLFAHMDLLNSHLHSEWMDGATTIRLRVPKQFNMIAAPVAAEAEAQPAEGTPAEAAKKPARPEPVIDERQPKFLNVELPGLRGAFFAPMRTVNSNAADAPEQYGFIYVLSNHHLAASADQAKTFGIDVAKMLTDELKMPEVKEWESGEYPRTATFAETLQYRSTTINPPRPIGNSEVQFFYNIFENGDIRIVVLFVLPRDVEASEKMTDRIPLCLETLRVDGDRLRPIVGESASSTGPGF